MLESINVLVLGGGAREHALTWKIAKSPQCKRVFLHPGNGGTHHLGIPTLGNLPLSDKQAIAQTAKDYSIRLVVIGPESLLAQGYADYFRKEGFWVVGPGVQAAEIETSKVFAKQLMKRAGIPTAPFSVVGSPEELAHSLSDRHSWPVVLKLDGLAGGKGVVIAHNGKDAKAFGARIWKENTFGPGAHRLVVEEFIHGKEVTYIGLCDGNTFLPFPSSTDYKRVGEGDIGPNTGGMGVISPSPHWSIELQEMVDKTVVKRLLARFRKENIEYRGALYVGTMVTRDGQPFVLEFNARFGDPETQALLMRMDSDLLPLLLHTAHGKLEQCPPPRWNPKVSVYVVGAASGYPEKVKTGERITGLGNIQTHIRMFFAGIGEKNGDLITTGGRVLGLGALGDDIQTARTDVYNNLKEIHWRGMHYRKDIGSALTM